MKNTFSIFRTFALAAFLLISIDGAAQAPGSLDTTFGTGGIVTTHLNVTATLKDMIIQPDGKIIVVGTTFGPPPPGQSPFAQTALIARFNSNGTLDTTFDSDGYVNSFFMLDANSVVLQTDGKIIVAGVGGVGSTAGFGVTRFNSDGSLDTTFDGDGKVATAVGVDATVTSVNVQADGKIVASGYTALSTNYANRDFALVRYNADGSLDTTFGTGGRVATDVGGSTDLLYDSAVQTDGKIVTVGYSTDALANLKLATIIRYNTNGTLDSTFGTGGKLIRSGSADSYAAEVAIQPDGKIIIVGEGMPPVRYNSNGSVDTVFQSVANFIFLSVVIQSNGKIVAAGCELTGGPSNFALARYNTDGTFDATFGTGGKVITDVPSSSAIYAVAIQPDGKIVAGGTELNDNFEIVLARYFGDSTSRRSLMDFNGDGKSDISIFRPSAGMWFTSTSPADNYGAIQFGGAADKITPADYDGDGKTDVAVFRPSNGTWYIQRSQAGFTGIGFGAADDIPMPADFDGDGKADLAVFRPSNGVWYIQGSQTGFVGVAFGALGDKPVAADYDGDGKTDIAVFRPSNGVWYLQRSTLGFTGIQFGDSADKPVVGDYDGDRKADFAVFRPSNGIWYLQQSTAGFTGIGFGAGDDLPVPADYDGDGKTDVSVFRPSNGVWYLNQSTAGFTGVAFGASSDKPIPNAFVP